MSARFLAVQPFAKLRCWGIRREVSKAARNSYLGNAPIGLLDAGSLVEPYQRGEYRGVGRLDTTSHREPERSTRTRPRPSCTCGSPSRLLGSQASDPSG